MNKFRWFLGRISAETCQKVDYFGSISSKLPKASGGSLPDLRLDLMNRECAKTLLPLTFIVDADAIGNFGAKQNLIILYFLTVALELF